MSTAGWKALFVLTMVGMLAACAGPGPGKSALSPQARSNIAIRSVTVDVSAIGQSTDGRQVGAATVKRVLEDKAASLVGLGIGSIPTRVEIKLESVNVITAGQIIMIGGESVMAGKVTLVDARDGSIIIPATRIDAGGGGWVLGGLIAAATKDDADKELQDMSTEFVSRTKKLILGV